MRSRREATPAILAFYIHWTYLVKILNVFDGFFDPVFPIFFGSFWFVFKILVRFGSSLVRFGSPSGKDEPKRTKKHNFWFVLVRLLITKKSVRRILPPKSPKVACAVEDFGDLWSCL